MTHRPAEIELRLLTENGDKEEVIEKNTSLHAIHETMEGLDWNDFHLVILSKSDYDSISVGGSLHKDGLACVYEENGVQIVKEESITSVAQMTALLVSYFNGDGAYKRIHKFTSESEDRKKFEVWKAGFVLQQKKDRLRYLKKMGVLFLVIASIWSGLYLWYTDEWKFIGRETAFAKAEVVNTQLHHLGRNRYIQIVTYAFEYDNEMYTGTHEVWKRSGVQAIGNLVKVKFSTSHPEHSKLVAYYKQNRNTRKKRPIRLSSMLENELTVLSHDIIYKQSLYVF